VKETTARQH